MVERNSETEPDAPIVISAKRARGGIITGRVVVVLAVSMLLALIAMVMLLNRSWT